MLYKHVTKFVRRHERRHGCREPTQAVLRQVHVDGHQLALAVPAVRGVVVAVGHVQVMLVDLDLLRVLIAPYAEIDAASGAAEVALGQGRNLHVNELDVAAVRWLHRGQDRHAAILRGLSFRHIPAQLDGAGDLLGAAVAERRRVEPVPRASMGLAVQPARFLFGVFGGVFRVGLGELVDRRVAVRAVPSNRQGRAPQGLLQRGGLGHSMLDLCTPRVLDATPDNLAEVAWVQLAAQDGLGRVVQAERPGCREVHRDARQVLDEVVELHRLARVHDPHRSGDVLLVVVGAGHPQDPSRVGGAREVDRQLLGSTQGLQGLGGGLPRRNRYSGDQRPVDVQAAA